jgi:hypothetical protein
MKKRWQYTAAFDDAELLEWTADCISDGGWGTPEQEEHVERLRYLAAQFREKELNK